MLARKIEKQFRCIHEEDDSFETYSPSTVRKVL